MTQEEHDIIDREIERLKTRLQTAKEWNQLTEIDLKNLRSIAAEQYQDLQHLKALLTRAADALEEEFGEPTLKGRDLSNKSPWNLIIELRKAAK